MIAVRPVELRLGSGVHVTGSRRAAKYWFCSLLAVPCASDVVGSCAKILARCDDLSATTMVWPSLLLSFVGSGARLEPDGDAAGFRLVLHGRQMQR